MAAATTDDLHRPSSSAASAPNALGLSRRKDAIFIAAGATAFWFVFEIAGYSFLSVMASAFLLVVVILFLWAKAATLLNRPLPPLPNFEVSDEVVEKVADEARLWINRVLGVASDIAIKRDRMVFLQVIIFLWIVSYVGSLFNFLTLVYIGVLLYLATSVLYDKYQNQVDQKLEITRKVILRQYTNILSRTGHQSKEKKTQ